MRLSIVTVTWNSAPDVEDAVRSGREQDAEVIVVDNASSDGSADVSRRAGANLVIETGANLGFGRGCNVGLEKATGEIVLFLNPDARLAPSAASALIKFFQDHPRADIVGPGIFKDDGRPVRSAGTSWSLVTEIANKTLLHRLMRPPTGTRGVGWVTGAALACRVDSLRRLGGFDAEIFLYYEDLDLCARARMQGMEIWFTDTVHIFHRGKRSSEHVEEHALVASHNSAEWYWRKHGGVSRWLVYRVLTIPEMALRSFLWAVMSFLPRKRQQALARLRAYRRILAITLGGKDRSSPGFRRES